MASLNLSGNNNNYYRIEAGDKTGTWELTLPSQNDTLATLADVFQLGSPWKFKGGVDITGLIPVDDNGNVPVAGDAFVNEVDGKPNAVWLGLDPTKIIPKDALIVLDDSGDWHELSSSEIDPIFQNSPAGSISENDKSKWSEAWDWGNHATFNYLTYQAALAYGFNDYNNSTWADPQTQAQVPLWNDAYSWGDHSKKGYITLEDGVNEGFGAYNQSVWADQRTILKIPLWDEAHEWGDHKEGVGGNKYLTEVTTLGSIGDVSVPTPNTDEVLTAVVSDGVVQWQSKKVNVIVEGELIFKGAIDATTEEPREIPVAGHLYVHTGGEENPNDEYTLLGDWSPVEKAKYGAKLAFGDDGAWHNIGNAGVGTDLTSFKVINNPNMVVGGELHYNDETGTFTYFKTDTFTQDEIIRKLAEKANIIDVYKKSEVYNKGEVDALLKNKADVGDSYTKKEADEILQGVRQNDVVFLNKSTIDRGIRITDGWNGVSAGPINLESGEAIIEKGSEWTVVGGATGGDVMTSIFDVKGSPMYAEFQAVKNKAARVSELEKEVQELKGMVKQLIKGIK